jgi:hypothetical protein
VWYSDCFRDKFSFFVILFKTRLTLLWAILLDLCRPGFSFDDGVVVSHRDCNWGDSFGVGGRVEEGFVSLHLLAGMGVEGFPVAFETSREFALEFVGIDCRGCSKRGCSKKGFVRADQTVSVEDWWGERGGRIPFLGLSCVLESDCHEV